MILQKLDCVSDVKGSIKDKRCLAILDIPIIKDNKKNSHKYSKLTQAQIIFPTLLSLAHMKNACSIDSYQTKNN